MVILQINMHIKKLNDSICFGDLHKSAPSANIDKDAIEYLRDLPGIGGIMQGVDPVSGRVLFRRKNIVTLRGRTFALENLYKDLAPAESGYVRDLLRQINLFKVGSGGAPINDPFSPIAPSALDLDLVNPVAFRTVNRLVAETALLDEEVPIYQLPVVDGDYTYYYGKRFENTDPEWVLDKDKNTVYKVLNLMISPKDVRNAKINELGLVFSTSEFGSPELYSRVTFDTESFTEIKGLLFQYFTYA